MADAGASAEAALAADPEGVWPTIAMSHRLAHQGKTDEGIALARKAVAAGGGGAATTALAHAQEAKGIWRTPRPPTGRRWPPTPRASTRSWPRHRPPQDGARRRGGAHAEEGHRRLTGAVEAYKELARTRIALGRAQEALADANLAAAMSENDPDAQELVIEAKVGRALQDLAAGQTDLAVQDLTKLRDENPASATVRLGLGRAQIARRDPDAALPELQKAVELDPKNAEAQYSSATCTT